MVSQRRISHQWSWVTMFIVLGAAALLWPAYLSRARAAREETLFQAIEQGNHTRVEALLRSGVSVNARRHSNPPTPLEPFLRMRTQWENPDYPFQIGYTPLMTASISGDVQMATLLLNRGANVQALECEHVGPTALELAVEYRHPAVVRLLLDRGADPNGTPGSYGPLLEAWRQHDQATMALLLSRGAKPLPPALKKPVLMRD